jgi:hypothetical protein
MLATMKAQEKEIEKMENILVRKDAPLTQKLHPGNRTTSRNYTSQGNLLTNRAQNNVTPTRDSQCTLSSHKNSRESDSLLQVDNVSLTTATYEAQEQDKHPDKSHPTSQESAIKSQEGGSGGLKQRETRFQSNSGINEYHSPPPELEDDYDDVASEGWQEEDDANRSYAGSFYVGFEPAYPDSPEEKETSEEYGDDFEQGSGEVVTLDNSPKETEDKYQELPNLESNEQREPTPPATLSKQPASKSLNNIADRIAPEDVFAESFGTSVHSAPEDTTTPAATPQHQPSIVLEERRSSYSESLNRSLYKSQSVIKGLEQTKKLQEKVAKDGIAGNLGVEESTKSLERMGEEESNSQALRGSFQSLEHVTKVASYSHSHPNLQHTQSRTSQFSVYSLPDQSSHSIISNSKPTDKKMTSVSHSILNSSNASNHSSIAGPTDIFSRVSKSKSLSNIHPTPRPPSHLLTRKTHSLCVVSSKSKQANWKPSKASHTLDCLQEEEDEKGAAEGRRQVNQSGQVAQEILADTTKRLEVGGDPIDLEETREISKAVQSNSVEEEMLCTTKKAPHMTLQSKHTCSTSNSANDISERGSSLLCSPNRNQSAQQLQKEDNQNSLPPKPSVKSNSNFSVTSASASASLKKPFSKASLGSVENSQDRMSKASLNQMKVSSRLGSGQTSQDRISTSKGVSTSRAVSVLELKSGKAIGKRSLQEITIPAPKLYRDVATSMSSLIQSGEGAPKQSRSESILKATTKPKHNLYKNSNLPSQQSM